MIQEWWSHIIGFDKQNPILFTQWDFWVFFAVVYLLFTLIVSGKRGSTASRLHLRNVYLMIASWVFYYKTSGVFLLILLFLTLTSWLIGQAVSSAQQRQKPVLKRLSLVIGVVVDLAVLGYFKYAYFGVDALNRLIGTHLTITEKIVLPVGISFYTFQVISYISDVYHERIKPVTNILDFAFYVSFFPQLVAGPIVRASEFVKQLYRPFHLSKRQFGIAVFWILNGLIKKVILSDFLATQYIDRVFENPMLFSGLENLLALFTYSLQVYADFSGYTDMAIGVAMLMGFYLPLNFHSPYKAANPQDFWRRWHISLSRWLKTYVYIPLGGNRQTTAGTYICLAVIAVVALLLSGKVWVTVSILAVTIVVGIVAYLRPQRRKLLYANMNSFITMLIGGLWHGASWNFIIWGGLNGIGMIVNKIWREWSRPVQLLVMSLLTAVMVLWREYGSQSWLNIVCVWCIVLLIGTVIRFVVWLCKKENSGVSRWCGQAWAVAQTFVFITFTRLFFRSSSNLDPATANEQAWQSASQMMTQISTAWNQSTILPILWQHRLVILLFILGMIIHWMPDRFKQWYRLQFAYLPVWLMAVIVVVVVAVLYQFMSSGVQPFIYFQF